MNCLKVDFTLLKAVVSKAIHSVKWKDLSVITKNLMLLYKCRIMYFTLKTDKYFIQLITVTNQKNISSGIFPSGEVPLASRWYDCVEVINT